ncbi:aspartate/glutamate racemase family protein [Sphingosinithalassobacter portus]|uniref:aspartate/glutamate racemase family protein n=1 Tax=Stakelama portus TaxID=2676234 RepID=UPI000D6E115A|nr:aspartate/glutamate racemase family protein [Sphingosinithalassobacter portus]
MMGRIGLLGSQPVMPPAVPAPELSDLLTEGQSLRIFPSPVGLFPRTPLDVLLQEAGHMEAALRAEEAGCVGAVIDSIGDYGLEAMRGSLSIPVAGAGEEGVRAAAAGGRRFAIVTVWPESMNFIPRRTMDRQGRAGACTGIHNVGSETQLETLAGPDGYLEQIRTGASSLRKRIAAACADARDQGAEAILLGCTCMSALARDIAAETPLPVINPLAAGLSALLSGGVPASRGAFRTPAREALTMMVDALSTMPAEDCSVCVTQWDEI